MVFESLEGGKHSTRYDTYEARPTCIIPLPRPRTREHCWDGQMPIRETVRIQAMLIEARHDMIGSILVQLNFGLNSSASVSWTAGGLHASLKTQPAYVAATAIMGRLGGVSDSFGLHGPRQAFGLLVWTVSQFL
jgi:hypothetical protein